MKRMLRSALMAVAAMVLCSTMAHAWMISGRVLCGENSEPVAGIPIEISATSGVSFSASTVSGSDGGYVFYLPDTEACYLVSLVLGAGQSAVTPASGTYAFCTADVGHEVFFDFLVNTPECAGEEEGACWLTAGGAKFSAITGTNLGEHGPQHSWGGNVYPGCSPTAGDGGNWNHVAHALKLHFQGREIVVERCGNIAGIPPGSTSPVTPFNFIEFHGVGTLKGIKGNKDDFGTVYFWGHCEDRNEPGSSGQRDGAGKDRYFLHVYSNPASPNTSTLLLIDLDGNPATVDPVTITDGNMQIHISSCDDPALSAARAADKATQQQDVIVAPASGTTWGRLKTIYR